MTLRSGGGRQQPIRCFGAGVARLCAQATAPLAMSRSGSTTGRASRSEPGSSSGSWMDNDDDDDDDEMLEMGDDVLRRSFSQIMAQDAYLVTRLAIVLIRLFGFGWKWMVMLLRLLVFIGVLLPDFLHMFYRYATSRRIHRSIRYGFHGRSLLDVYIPEDVASRPAKGWPVVIFFAGGAWIIGHRAWAALMGWQMCQKGVLFVSPDYRNFPQGQIVDMLIDTSDAVAWVFDHIIEFGGDVTNITLSGQSAGAHLAAVSLIRQAAWERIETRVAWRASRLRRFIGISGPYDLDAVCTNLHGRGLYRRVICRIMGRDLALFSPTVSVSRADRGKLALDLLPDIVLFHGDADRTVPHASSIGFCDALRRAGLQPTLHICPGKSHTDMILEDPMGGVDPFLPRFVAIVKEEAGPGEHAPVPPASASLRIRLARWVNPF